MNIDWQYFTPYSALLGGFLIGAAATLFLWLKGRIAGISGILGGLFEPQAAGERIWRVAFVFGLLISPWVYSLFAAYPVVDVEASPTALVLAGLLVGFGTRYGSGCTSGHGICGLSRFSFRSLVATLCFMTAGFATVFVVRHVLGT